MCFNTRTSFTQEVASIVPQMNVLKQLSTTNNKQKGNVEANDDSSMTQNLKRNP